MMIKDLFKKPQLTEVYVIAIYFTAMSCLILFHSHSLFNSL